jgi:pre-mRNA-splicing factor SPF27
LDNLELLNQFGANAWIKHNEFLDSRKVKYEAMLDEAQKEVEELNKLRKAEQEEAGAKLYNLQAKFHGHLHKNMQIDNACLQIEADIEKCVLLFDPGSTIS